MGVVTNISKHHFGIFVYGLFLGILGFLVAVYLSLFRKDSLFIFLVISGLTSGDCCDYQKDPPP